MTEPYWEHPAVTLWLGDCREVLRSLDAESVQCAVTSPPYWSLRDYGLGPDALGLEPTPALFVENMVDVFREVRRVLRADGTLWLNIGDSYATRPYGEKHSYGLDVGARNRGAVVRRPFTGPPEGVKAKELIGIPWMLAFALRADGWRIRQENIWHKPNPTPESVKDRTTRAHEQLFMLTRSEHYYYDAAAIKEPASLNTHDRTRKSRATPDQKCAPGAKVNGVRPRKDGFNARWAARVPGVGPKAAAAGSGTKYNESFAAAVVGAVEDRNKRSVWSIPTAPFPEAHFATFPPALVEPCILAGSREGDTVLDPFVGSGTTAMVARDLGRKAIGIDASEPYLEMAVRRIGASMTLPMGGSDAT